MATCHLSAKVGVYILPGNAQYRGYSMAPRLLTGSAILVALLVLAPWRPDVSRAFPVLTATPATSVVPTSTGGTAQITDLWASTDGTRSGTVYAGQRTDLTLAYNFGTGAPSGARWATFEVVAHGAMIVQARTQLSDQRSGTVVYHLTKTLPTGLLQFRGILTVGGLLVTAHRQIASLNLQAFLGSTAPGAAQARLRVSRIESTAAALREKFVLSPGGSTLLQLGRQSGTFQSVRLEWPQIDPSQTAVQARLVSTFGTARAALAAFRQRVAQYRLDEACRTACALIVHPRAVDAKLGQQRAAFLLEPGLGVHVDESIFVRGHLIAEVWTYYVGAWGATAAKDLATAIADAPRALDIEAKRQQTA